MTEGLGPVPQCKKPVTNQMMDTGTMTDFGVGVLPTQATGTDLWNRDSAVARPGRREM